MELGQHILEGEIISLKNPFIIANAKNDDNMDESAPENYDMKVGGLVYKKIIFKTRPKPKGVKKS